MTPSRVPEEETASRPPVPVTSDSHENADLKDAIAEKMPELLHVDRDEIHLEASSKMNSIGKEQMALLASAGNDIPISSDSLKVIAEKMPELQNVDRDINHLEATSKSALKDMANKVAKESAAPNEGVNRSTGSQKVIAEKMPELQDVDRDINHLEATSKNALKDMPNKVAKESAAPKEGVNRSTGFQKTHNDMADMEAKELKDVNLSNGFQKASDMHKKKERTVRAYRPRKVIPPDEAGIEIETDEIFGAEECDGIRKNHSKVKPPYDFVKEVLATPVVLDAGADDETLPSCAIQSVTYRQFAWGEAEAKAAQVEAAVREAKLEAAEAAWKAWKAKNE